MEVRRWKLWTVYTEFDFTVKSNVYIIQIVSLHTFLLVSFFIGISVVKHVEISKVDSLKIRNSQQPNTKPDFTLTISFARDDWILRCKTLTQVAGIIYHIRRRVDKYLRIDCIIFVSAEEFELKTIITLRICNVQNQI